MIIMMILVILHHSNFLIKIKNILIKKTQRIGYEPEVNNPH